MEAYKHENIIHKQQFDLKFAIRFETVDDVNYYSPFHWHNHIEVLYIIDGEIDFKIEERSYLLTSGDVLIVNSEMIHSSKLHGHVRYVILQVPFSALNGIDDNVEAIRYREYFPQDEAKEISSELMKMLECAGEKKSESKIRFISLLYNFLYLLNTSYRLESSVRSKFSGNGISKISPVMTYVEKNFRNKISLKEVADIICVTPEHLCRMFKKYTDITFNEYLLSLRISSFYQSLVTSNQKISTLLEENGITNYKVFSREFKKTFGKTPESIRNELAQNESV